MTKRQWIDGHPWLEGVAAFQAIVDGLAVDVAPVPAGGAWEAAGAELEAGVPLLGSRAAGLDVAQAGGAALRSLATRLAAAVLPPAIAASVKALDATWREDPAAAEEAIRSLVRGSPPRGAPEGAGLVRYLGWSALRRVLAPVAAAFEDERDGRRWRRGSCPTCGVAPVVGALVAVADGRGRKLACGCCGTRWGFQRVACPFCGNEDADRLALLQVDQEPGHRLDVCEECKGYVKTWTGEGDAELALSDWPTLHLDVLARERGYHRHGASLYDIEK